MRRHWIIALIISLLCVTPTRAMSTSNMLKTMYIGDSLGRQAGEIGRQWAELSVLKMKQSLEIQQARAAFFASTPGTEAHTKASEVFAQKLFEKDQYYLMSYVSDQSLDMGKGDIKGPLDALDIISGRLDGGIDKAAEKPYETLARALAEYCIDQAKAAGSSVLSTPLFFEQAVKHHATLFQNYLVARNFAEYQRAGKLSWFFPTRESYAYYMLQKSFTRQLRTPESVQADYETLTQALGKERVLAIADRLRQAEHAATGVLVPDASIGLTYNEHALHMFLKLLGQESTEMMLWSSIARSEAAARDGDLDFTVPGRLAAELYRVYGKKNVLSTLAELQQFKAEDNIHWFGIQRVVEPGDPDGFQDISLLLQERLRGIAPVASAQRPPVPVKLVDPTAYATNTTAAENGNAPFAIHGELAAFLIEKDAKPTVRVVNTKTGDILHDLQLHADNDKNNPRFGESLAINEHVVAVGGSIDWTGNAIIRRQPRYVKFRRGKVWVFDLETGQARAAFSVPHRPEHTLYYAGFGASVALDGKRMLVGAPLYRPKQPDSNQPWGAAFLYNWETWACEAVLTTDDWLLRVGQRVALSGNRALVAQPAPSRSNVRHWGVHLFDLERQSVITRLGVPLEMDRQPPMGFGHAITLDEGLAVVGQASPTGGRAHAYNAQNGEPLGVLSPRYPDPPHKLGLSPLAEVVAGETHTADHLGSGVGLTADAIYLGGHGQVYRYDRETLVLQEAITMNRAPELNGFGTQLASGGSAVAALDALQVPGPEPGLKPMTSTRARTRDELKKQAENGSTKSVDETRFAWGQGIVYLAPEPAFTQNLKPNEYDTRNWPSSDLTNAYQQRLAAYAPPEPVQIKFGYASYEDITKQTQQAVRQRAVDLWPAAELTSRDQGRLKNYARARFIDLPVEADPDQYERRASRIERDRNDYPFFANYTDAELEIWAKAEAYAQSLNTRSYMNEQQFQRDQAKEDQARAQYEEAVARRAADPKVGPVHAYVPPTPPAPDPNLPPAASDHLDAFLTAMQIAADADEARVMTMNRQRLSVGLAPIGSLPLNQEWVQMAAGFWDLYLQEGSHGDVNRSKEALQEMMRPDRAAFERIKSALPFVFAMRVSQFDGNASTLAAQQKERLAAGTLAADKQLDLRATSRQIQKLKNVHHDIREVYEWELGAATAVQTGEKASTIRRRRGKTVSSIEDLREALANLAALQGTTVEMAGALSGTETLAVAGLEPGAMADHATQKTNQPSDVSEDSTGSRRPPRSGPTAADPSSATADAPAPVTDQRREPPPVTPPTQTPPAPSTPPIAIEHLDAFLAAAEIAAEADEAALLATNEARSAIKLAPIEGFYPNRDLVHLAAGFWDQYLQNSRSRNVSDCQRALGALSFADEETGNRIQTLLTFAFERRPRFDETAGTMSAEQTKRLATGTLEAVDQLNLRTSTKHFHHLKMIRDYAAQWQAKELEAIAAEQSGDKASNIRRLKAKAKSLHEDMLKNVAALEALNAG